MKKVFLLSIFLFFGAFLYALEIKESSKIVDATVYLQGAVVTSQVDSKLTPGVQTIVITDLPTNIDEKSIQVSGTGNATILDVRYDVNYVDPKSESPEIEQLRKRKKSLQSQKNKLDAQIDAFDVELKLIDKNMSLAGSESGLKITEVQSAADFIRIRLNEIYAKKMEVYEQSDSLHTVIVRVENELRKLTQHRNKVQGEVHVTLESNSTQNVQLYLSYYIVNAGWIPYYDIRVDDITKPLSLIYKAKVFQQTGIDWDNIKLTLSTGNPTLGGTVPSMEKWALKRFVPQPIMEERANYSMSKKSIYSSVVCDYEANESMTLETDALGAAPMDNITASVDSKLTTVEFAIQNKVSVSSSNERAQVTIKEYELPAEYIYKVVPKYDPDAFLISKVTGYEKLNLLSGDANLFFEGSFVGESYINMTKAQDTLELSLGRDNGIVVERKKIDEYTSKKTFAGKTREAAKYEISVKNNKPSNVHVQIVDQYPVSTQEEIKVYDVEHPEAIANSETGIVTWDFQVGTLSLKKVTFLYTIEYPKNWIINN